MTLGSLNHEIFDPYNAPVTLLAVTIMALSQLLCYYHVLKIRHCQILQFLKNEDGINISAEIRLQTTDNTRRVDIHMSTSALLFLEIHACFINNRQSPMLF